MAGSAWADCLAIDTRVGPKIAPKPKAAMTRITAIIATISPKPCASISVSFVRIRNEWRGAGGTGSDLVFLGNIGRTSSLKKLGQALRAMGSFSRFASTLIRRSIRS